MPSRTAPLRETLEPGLPTALPDIQVSSFPGWVQTPLNSTSAQAPGVIFEKNFGRQFFGLNVRAWFEVREKFDSTNTLSMFGFPNKLFEFRVRVRSFNFGIGSGGALKRAPQK
jgi:hypothetical protein